jgi:hypothetical protein
MYTPFHQEVAENQRKINAAFASKAQGGHKVKITKA